MQTGSMFEVGDRVVYPSHGVGEIIGIDQEMVAGQELRLYVISFPQERMTLKVPVSKAATSGLRCLVNKSVLAKVYETLQSKPKQGNRMWSRRAQEYEGKINSGDVVAVAEVVRDLYKNVDSDRSYSERTIYESALNRLAGELAILEEIDAETAICKLTDLLKQKIAA